MRHAGEANDTGWVDSSGILLESSSVLSSTSLSQPEGLPIFGKIKLITIVIELGNNGRDGHKLHLVYNILQ